MAIEKKDGRMCQDWRNILSTPETTIFGFRTGYGGVEGVSQTKILVEPCCKSTANYVILQLGRSPVQARPSTKYGVCFGSQIVARLL